MPKRNANSRPKYSQFFLDCGFTLESGAQTIDTALERRMETLRYQQREKGLCTCIAFRGPGRMRVKLCRGKPHTSKNGRPGPFGYCKRHQHFRKTHSLKYLGFNVVGGPGRPRKVAAVKSWKRPHKFQHPKRSAPISLRVIDEAVVALALLELRELRL